MGEILLVEPNYKNKYPPLGLMKLAYYHKKYRGDNVQFIKGTDRDKDNEEAFQVRYKKWDRIYVTTLFTFEWEATKEAILFAKELVDDISKIFVGGIASSLMPGFYEKATGIKPVVGLLNSSAMLDYQDEVCIDKLPPDYSILEQIKYKYPTANSYFAYTTRGCGMNCGFCAVKTLEPVYEKRISIAEQIFEVVEREKEEKKDLLLMDNNVLKSSEFDLIIDELVQLGFGKGATYYNPKTKKTIARYVDFNQGLDGHLLTSEKAAQLARLNIRPVRIAFDHIEDKETYSTALKNCAKNGLKVFSNYILYNSPDFSGKGKKYKADSPEDLYQRLDINFKLLNEVNKELGNEEPIAVYSFPMRYIPLDATERGFVGPEWNKKFLRAIQVMYIPTKGRGIASETFFKADFGKSLDEFKNILYMPEWLIASRGHKEAARGKTKANKGENNKRKQLKIRQNSLLKEWNRLLRFVDKENLLGEIKDNKFSPEHFFELEEENLRKIYIYYLSESMFLDLLNQLEDERDFNFISTYCLSSPSFMDRMVSYIFSNRLLYHKLNGFIKVFGSKGIKRILTMWVQDNFNNDYVLDILNKACIATNFDSINIPFLQIFSLCFKSQILSEEEVAKFKNNILKGKADGIYDKLEEWKERLIKDYQKKHSNTVGAQILLQAMEQHLLSAVSSARDRELIMQGKIF